MAVFIRTPSCDSFDAEQEASRIDWCTRTCGYKVRRQTLKNHLVHHAYPTLDSYLEHMNRYSSLGAQMVTARSGRAAFSFVDIVIRPRLTFFYNYFLRGGFLDGREGLLLHLYHADYVSWKYAKAWERSRNSAG